MESEPPPKQNPPRPGSDAQADPGARDKAPRRRKPRAASRRELAFARQELRLISALVVLMGLALFLALPFVLSIGAVVFLPLTTAVLLTILLSPLADRLIGWGLPNALASLLALVVFVAIVLAALALVLQPALALYDDLPQMLDIIAARFSELRSEFAWLERLDRQLGELMGAGEPRAVVLASPSMLEQLAFATPSVLLEALLTILMAFFMLEGRGAMRRHLLFDRASHTASVKAARVLREVQDRVANYILTVAGINAGVGVIVALGAWALGVDAPVMWGGLAAILNFLPYIGPLAMTMLLALFGIATGENWLVGLIPAGAYLALHTIESNVVTPSILGARFTMNPVMILIALSYFSWIWGVFGALLSVPILLTVTALIDNLGKPNLVGFVFGEPLFPSSALALGDYDDAA